jgi:hypothetical protein
MQSIGRITMFDKVLELTVGRYPAGGHAYVEATVLPTGPQENEAFPEPYGRLSVNIPEAVIPDNCFHVKTWSENGAMAQAARASGLFVDTGLRAATGFAVAQVWRFAHPEHVPPVPPKAAKRRPHKPALVLF